MNLQGWAPEVQPADSTHILDRACDVLLHTDGSPPTSRHTELPASQAEAANPYAGRSLETLTDEELAIAIGFARRMATQTRGQVVDGEQIPTAISRSESPLFQLSPTTGTRLIQA